MYLGYSNKPMIGSICSDLKSKNTTEKIQEMLIDIVYVIY